VGGHLIVKGFQEPPWKQPEALIIPLAIGLILGVGKGLWHLRQAKQTVPGAVIFDRYGFSIVGRGRVSWRLLTRAILEERPEWRWRFCLGDQLAIIASSAQYSREQWKQLSEEFTRRLNRRKIEVLVIGAGQLDPDLPLDVTDDLN
jgi:hypothetical protein